MPVYFKYETPANALALNRICGDPLLPALVQWPLDEGGRKMIFIGSISSELLNSETSVKIPEGHLLSVFCPFEKNSVDIPIGLARHGAAGCVIHHPVGTPRSCEELPKISAKLIEKIPSIETDEDEFSEDLEDKMGGSPNWLQDRIDFSRSEFVAQFSGMYFEKIFPELKGIFMGGMLYVFFDSKLNQGFIRLQYS
ncbi:DUF1963 domain-containing protein [Diaphorobacter aerolatus]|uniref:DUF1963 domain-containing protein n=1 Tax=Diaphorobacter aerolatus TaxID=1288495 RepID=A0A7H0GGX3_9BURK|nr:DUF1963 domain-containing protein [Diaphorobacter aerolatus]QNP47539.1 DUF1963 domain-containing protein [Diaphorobacter aerolatus]